MKLKYIFMLVSLILIILMVDYLLNSFYVYGNYSNTYIVVKKFNILEFLFNQNHGKYKTDFHIFSKEMAACILMIVLSIYTFLNMLFNMNKYNMIFKIVNFFIGLLFVFLVSNIRIDESVTYVIPLLLIDLLLIASLLLNSLLIIINDNKRIRLILSPFIMIVFIFVFAYFLGEYEFVLGIIGKSTVRYA